MKEWRVYKCDFNHTWTVIREQGAPELPADTLCPFGHDAVTCQVQPAADVVSFRLESAARIVDDVTGQLANDLGWSVIVVDRDGREVARTTNDVSWDRAVKLMSALRGKTPDRARSLSQRLFA